MGFRRTRSVQLGTDRLVTPRMTPSLERRSQEGRRASMISTSRGILLELQRGNASGRPAGVLRSVFHERLGLRATGRALASRAGMLAESPERDGLTHKAANCALTAWQRPAREPTGAKIIQTELDRLARDEAGGGGGSAAPFSSSSTGIAHHLAFFRKSMFNPPDSNGLTATLKSS